MVGSRMPLSECKDCYDLLLHSHASTPSSNPAAAVYAIKTNSLQTSSFILTAALHVLRITTR